MTDEELRKLADEATPGPWKITNDVYVGESEVYCHWHRVGSVDLPGKVADADSRFIAAVRAAVPDLLKRVAALEARLREEEEWKARFVNDSEAYKQGFEDGMKALEKSIADKLDGMEPNRATALKAVFHVVGMLKE